MNVTCVGLAGYTGTFFVDLLIAVDYFFSCHWITAKYGSFLLTCLNVLWCDCAAFGEASQQTLGPTLIVHCYILVEFKCRGIPPPSVYCAPTQPFPRASVWFEMCWGQRRIRRYISTSAGYNDAYVFFSFAQVRFNVRKQ